MMVVWLSGVDGFAGRDEEWSGCLDGMVGKMGGWLDWLADGCAADLWGYEGFCLGLRAVTPYLGVLPPTFTPIHPPTHPPARTNQLAHFP